MFGVATRQRRDPSARGQVGIGTLIVFIAMVLVAAIAAGVLMNTAGYLETKAQATGERAGLQVVNRLQVVATTGTHLGGADVGVVNVTVKRAPGAENIDLENATVQWVGPSGSYRLVNASADAGGADGHFGVATFTDVDDSHPVLDDPDDRFVLVFDLGTDQVDVDDATSGATGRGATYFGEQLPAGSAVHLRITTQAGATTTEHVTVPGTLSGESAIWL